MSDYTKCSRRSANSKIIGVFVGQMNYDWMVQDIHLMLGLNRCPYAGPAAHPAISANRAFLTLRIMGFNIIVNSAYPTSSTLLHVDVAQAVHQQCFSTITCSVGLLVHEMSMVGECNAHMLFATDWNAAFNALTGSRLCGENSRILMTTLNHVRTNCSAVSSSSSAN
jgi:hypothetical protein